MNVFSDLKLNSKTSVYLQIIQHVKRKILNKSIIAYTPLPYKLMEEEGILRTISNVKSVVYVDEQIMERLQQEMIQETVDDFIANCRECGLPFQKVVAILSTRWDI